MFKQFLDTYLGFNKQQKKGLLVLAFISLSLIILRLVFPYFIKQDNIEVKNLPLVDIDSLEINESTQKREPINAKGDSVENLSHELFQFNPNTVSYNDLLRLGLKEKTARTFIKFRNKGFKFNKKEDLKKVYGVDQAFYQKLEPYIQVNFTSKSNEIKSNNEFYKKKTNTQEKTIEINSADSAELTKIKDIDASAAIRILKLRARLGGFVSVNQLNEVYGFEAKYVEKLKDKFEIDLNLVRRINPNTETIYTLKKHPYIGEELALQMGKLRKKQKLDLNTIAELINDKELFEKLRPYLSFE